ncbi:MAG: bifunctional 2-polyprenyl-6-hydroxyphenol methylase/3-demethylubiquinol 3-O-methyltransferase UbiG [Alphaproteobacteria bacterium]
MQPERAASNAASNAASIDEAEVAKFSALADRWWDARGPFRPLHKLTPVRMRYIRDRLAAHFGRDPNTPRPLAGLAVLDVGCGGGLVSEPLARLGATVTAIDASHSNIEAARLHAADLGLAIDYRHAAAEDLAKTKERYDAVLALEIIEHVADPDAFLTAMASLVRPGGAALMATLNRTSRSYLLAIVGAEYVLGWLPRGTHDWNRFMKPAELAAGLDRAGLATTDQTGVCYAPLADEWRLCDDLGVNYMVVAVRPGQG